MIISNILLTLRHQRYVNVLSYNVLRRNYAKAPAAASKGGKKKLGKIGPVVEKKILPVETDTDKLTKFVCGSNILKEGKDIELKPDSEYPDWLWSLHTGKPVPLNELNPESKEYWKRIRTMGLKRNNQLAKLKKF